METRLDRKSKWSLVTRQLGEPPLRGGQAPQPLYSLPVLSRERLENDRSRLYPLELRGVL